MNTARVLSLGLFLVMAGCGGDGASEPPTTPLAPTPPPAPTPAPPIVPALPPNPNLAGTWQGLLSIDESGTTTVTATLSLSGTSLTGEWVFGANYRGTFRNGLVNGDEFMVEFIPGDPVDCPFRANGSISGDRLRGTYVAFECSGPMAGEFDLARSER